jgi:hypothetical protein
MAGTGLSSDFKALEAVARDYLDGMTYADEARLRRAFHPKAHIVGHFRGRFEFDSLDAFIAACKAESLPPGTPYRSAVASIEVTGDIAVMRLTDDYVGLSFTDYLSLVKHDGRWQIVNKVFYVHPAD